MIRFILKSLVFVTMVATSGRAHGQAIVSQSGFGTTVAVAGDEAFVGESMNLRVPGMLYVYRKDAGGVWKEAQILKADDGHPEDRFSVFIEVEGDRMITSATRHDGERGAVYVFEKDSDGSWVQAAKIQPDSLEPGDRFGAGLAIDGNTIYASATPFMNPGRVYVFEMNEADGSWVETASFQNDPEADGNMFGTALEIADGKLFVGAPTNGNGVVYVYRTDETGSWVLSQTLSGRPAGSGDPVSGPDNESHFLPAPQGDMFGSVLRVKGEILLVTAPNHDHSTGIIYAYRSDPSGMYQRVMNLQPFDVQPGHLFARSLAFAGDQLWIGSNGNDDFKGSVYALEYDPERFVFEEAEKFAPEDIGQATLFGTALAANDSIAVVGAPRGSRQYGDAYIYERGDDGDWELAATVGSELQIQYSSITGDDLVKCEDGAAADYPCKNVDLVSYVTTKDLGAPRGVVTNDVWGWTDPETGKEYALVGRNDATSFIDISDPGNPVVLGSLQRTEGSPTSIWRDIKVYKDHAFIVADGAGAHGVQIFDLTQLRNVENPPVEFEETARYDGIHSAHNIVINEETGFAYTVGNRSGGETCAGGSHMINIQDPTNPVFAGCFAHVETGRQGTGYTHDGQCVVYGGPDERFAGREICFGANETAVSIADVTDKQNPIPISTGNYPNPGYTHQGWLSDDQRYLFVNDELDELNGGTDGTRTLIWDVAELDDPILVNEHVSQNKASDHNLYVRGNYMYQSNYVSGLRIVDVSDVENPVEVGYFDTVNWGEDRPGFGGSWSNYPFFKSGVIVVTSGEEGVFFVKRSDVDI